MASTSLRERFAHQKVVIEDRLRKEAPKAKARLARLWRRDAELIRKASIKAEHRAARAMAHGWEIAKPRIQEAKVSSIHAEHRIARNLWSRIHARAEIGMHQ